jgi:hypothetical protein
MKLEKNFRVWFDDNNSKTQTLLEVLIYPTW